MELLIPQLTSQNQSDILKSLNSLSSFFPVPESNYSELINILKNHLKKPVLEIVQKIFPLLSSLISVQPSIYPVLGVVPDLIHLLKYKKYKTHDFLLSFLPEILQKTADLKFIPKSLLDSGILRKSEELKLATLGLAVDLVNSGIDLIEMKEGLESLAQDMSDNVKSAALELVELINSHTNKSLIPLTLSEGQCFNCIPTKLIERLCTSTSWKEKCELIEIMKENLSNLEDFSQLLTSLPDFFSILNKILQDPHSRVTLLSLDLLQLLLKNEKICESPEIFSALPQILNKLGDTKISIRQAAHKLIRTFLLANPSEVVPSLIRNLDHTSWHIREESTIMLIFSMLTYPQGFDYLISIEKLARLLDDSRTKIRVISTEALAALGHILTQTVVLDHLVEIVDSEALKCLHKRFSVSSLPMITEDYVILSKEIPKDVRMISSPYLQPTPLDVKTLSVSYENIKSETPTTAETSSKRAGRKSFLNKTTRSVMAIHKSSSMVNIDTPEPTPAYIPYENLEKITHPSEALQKTRFHTETWYEQFDIVNSIRRLAKHNPEVFISKVTLHSIIVNLVKWADSLRSGLSKNSLIAICEIALSLGKILDGEVPDLMKVLLKKAADTNNFLADTAVEGLKAVCGNLTEGKVAAFLLIFAEQQKSPLIKSKIFYCFNLILDKSIQNLSKISDLGKLIQYINENLTDANPEVRSLAKQAYSKIIENMPNEEVLDLSSAPGLKYSTFRRMKDQFKKKTKPHSVSNFSISKKELRVTLPSLNKHKTKKLISNSARDLFATVKIDTEPEELIKLKKIQEDILSLDWKTRYDCVTSALELAKFFLSPLKEAGKLGDLVLVFELAIKDQNMKVLIHSLAYLAKLIHILKEDIEEFVKILIENVVVSLGCSNSSIREASCEVCILLGIHCKPDLLVPLLAESIQKTGPKGKPLALNVIVNLLPGMKNKAFMEGELLNLAYKYVDDTRLDVRNEANRILVFLYKNIGNTVIESTPTKKLNRVISVISNT